MQLLFTKTFVLTLNLNEINCPYQTLDLRKQISPQLPDFKITTKKVSIVWHDVLLKWGTAIDSGSPQRGKHTDTRSGRIQTQGNLCEFSFGHSSERALVSSTC